MMRTARYLVRTYFPLKMAKCEQKFLVNAHFPLNVGKSFQVDAHFPLYEFMSCFPHMNY